MKLKRTGLECSKETVSAVKTLLSLYRKVLHNVNNRIVYLDEDIYTTSRKHLSEFINSLVDFEPDINTQAYNDTLESCHSTLSLLELLEKSVNAVKLYPENGFIYYEILWRFYFDNFKYSHDDIADILEISRATYFRHFNNAVACFYLHFMGILKAEKYEFNDDVINYDTGRNNDKKAV